MEKRLEDPRSSETKEQTINIKLNDSPHMFHLRECISNLPERTNWVADTVPEMVNLITQIKSGLRDRPKVTTKNVVLQELEAISRDEKYNEAIRLGQRPLSLQHDGVVLGRTNRWGAKSCLKILQLKSSEALEYEQPLEVKKIPSHFFSSGYIWDREKDTLTKIYKTKIEKWSNKPQASLKKKLDKKEDSTTISFVTILHKGESDIGQSEAWERNTVISSEQYHHNHYYATLQWLYMTFTYVSNKTALRTVAVCAIVT